MEQSFAHKKGQKIGIGKILRHLLICTGPKCVLQKGKDSQCDESQDVLWTHLKKKCKELGVTPSIAMRTKVACLRICGEGPVAVVYPEGTWYSHLTLEKIDRIVKEHLLGGVPVQDISFASWPLGGAAGSNLATKSEDLAARFFIGNGYEILARNFRVPGSEIDLIVLKGQQLVAVEVKYRKSVSLKSQVHVQDLMNSKKISAIQKGMTDFIGKSSNSLDYKLLRIDLVTVGEKGVLFHFPKVQ